MSPKFLKLLAAGIFLLVFTAGASAQEAPKVQKAGATKQSAGDRLLDLTGKAAVIIVGQMGKAAWKTTRFTAGDVAKPAAKQVFLRIAPKLTVFALKMTGKAIEKGLPVAQKLAVTYLKTRLTL